MSPEVPEPAASRQLLEWGPVGDKPPPQGGCATFLCQPLDVLKTRLMNSKGEYQVRPLASVPCHAGRVCFRSVSFSPGEEACPAGLLPQAAPLLPSCPPALQGTHIRAWRPGLLALFAAGCCPQAVLGLPTGCPEHWGHPGPRPASPGSSALSRLCPAGCFPLCRGDCEAWTAGLLQGGLGWRVAGRPIVYPGLTPLSLPRASSRQASGSCPTPCSPSCFWSSCGNTLVSKC